MEIPLPIIAALTAALVSGGFSVLKRREEARLRYLERQIQDLYGPLYGLIQFGAAINELNGKACRRSLEMRGAGLEMNKEER